jgi:hypothetical protein
MALNKNTISRIIYMGIPRTNKKNMRFMLQNKNGCICKFKKNSEILLAILLFNKTTLLA